MKKIFIVFLVIFSFAKEYATKEDIQLILNKLDRIEMKLNELDKRVNENTIKIEMLEKTMNKRFEDINKRFEDMNMHFNKRFEEMNKRFEDMNKRFEDMNMHFNKRFEEMSKRFEDMMNYLWMIAAAFFGITAATIGFAIWDRKSMIKSAKQEIKEDIFEEIKREKLVEFIYELQKLAKKDPELQKVLKSFHLV